MDVQNSNYVDTSQNLMNDVLAAQNTANAAKNNPVVKEKEDTQKESNSAAVYEKSNDTAKKITYTPDKTKIQKMANEAMQKTEQLKTLVTKLFSKQGSTFEMAFSALLDGKLTVDNEIIMQAKEDISEDGYYGVKQTSQRILDFAKALSGGDPSKIDTLKDAVIKGFKNVERMWGKKEMPEITQQTYDAVMKGFDEWERGVDGDSSNPNKTPDIGEL